MAWPAPFLPSHFPPPSSPARTETESTTSTHTPTPPPPPPPAVTIQAPRASYDAEEMASRIERLQKSRGGVEGNTRERLYKKLVEEGLITKRETVEEDVGREFGKGNVNVAHRDHQPRGVGLREEGIQGKAEVEAVDLCGSNGAFHKGIPMPNKQHDERISKLGEAQLGSHDQQYFKANGPPAGHRVRSAKALASLAEHTNSPLDRAESAMMNLHKRAFHVREQSLLTSSYSPQEITAHNNTITTQQQSIFTPLSAPQISSKSRNAKQVIVRSAQRPAQAQKQTTAAANMSPEAARVRVLRSCAKASSAKTQTAIHASLDVSAAETPPAPGSSAPKPAPLPPVTPISQELPKQSEVQPTPHKTIQKKKDRHAQFTTPTPKQKKKKRREQRSPPPVRIPGHSYTSTGRHHTKCKQCTAIRNLEEINRIRTELAAKCPKPIVRQPTPFGHYPDNEDWQKTSMAHRSLETRNPFLGSTSASLTSEMAGHMPSTGMGVRSRTEGGAWDMPPMYTCAPGKVDGPANQDAQSVYGPDYLQGLEREHPNIPKARQEELNWLVRTNQITGLDLLAEVALADWTSNPPRPWAGRPVFPESNARALREGLALDYKRREFFTEEDRAMATKDDTIYEGEIQGQRSNRTNEFSSGPGNVWNENRTIQYEKYAHRHDEKDTSYRTREPIPYSQGDSRDIGQTATRVPTIKAPVTPIKDRHIFKVNQDGSGRWYSLVYSPSTDSMLGYYGTTTHMLKTYHQGQPVMEEEELTALDETEVEETIMEEGELTALDETDVEETIMEEEELAALDETDVEETIMEEEELTTLEETEVEEPVMEEEELEETEVEEELKQHLAAVPKTKAKTVKRMRKASKSEEKGVEAAPKQDLAAERVFPKATGKKDLRGGYKNKRKIEGQDINKGKEKADREKIETDSEPEYRRSQSTWLAAKKGGIVKDTMNMKKTTQVESSGWVGEYNYRAGGKRSATDAELDGSEIHNRAKMDGVKTTVQHYSEGEKEGSTGKGVKKAQPAKGLFSDELIRMILPKNTVIEFEKAELDGGEKKENQAIKEGSKVKAHQSSDGEKQGGNRVGAWKFAMDRLTNLCEEILPKEMEEELEEGEIYEG
ncbi:hypothetical protein EV426DRAFT_703588 [Tirmania nivea]|nr:hypothetical protein EV426DRAFT_703588 [Tirmania nivea]